MTRRNRKIKLELSVSEAVALYYAAVSGCRKADRLILKSLELLAEPTASGVWGDRKGARRKKGNQNQL
jgi:hypothetical protein